MDDAKLNVAMSSLGCLFCVVLGNQIALKGAIKVPTKDLINMNVEPDRTVSSYMLCSFLGCLSSDLYDGLLLYRGDL